MKTRMTIVGNVTATLIFGVMLRCSTACNYWVDDAKPFEELLGAAKAAVAQVGGCAVLATEADAVLVSMREHEAGGHLFSQDEWEAYAPAMRKMEELLPQAVSSWVVCETHYVHLPDKIIAVPEHVAVRFGTHSSYAWILVFSATNTLSELPQDVVHIGGTVYVSRNNL